MWWHIRVKTYLLNINVLFHAPMDDCSMWGSACGISHDVATECSSFIPLHGKPGGPHEKACASLPLLFVWLLFACWVLHLVLFIAACTLLFVRCAFLQWGHMSSLFLRKLWEQPHPYSFAPSIYPSEEINKALLAGSRLGCHSASLDLSAAQVKPCKGCCREEHCIYKLWEHIPVGAGQACREQARPRQYIPGFPLACCCPGNSTELYLEDQRQSMKHSVIRQFQVLEPENPYSVIGIN